MSAEFCVELSAVTLEVEGRRFLDAVDLQVPFGQTVVFCGSSSCGKSFVLRLVQGLPGVQRGDNMRLWGDVLVAGQSVFDLDSVELQQLRRRMGVVMRGGVLIDNMDIRRNIALPLVYHEGSSLDMAAIDERCQRTAAALGIEHLLMPGLRPVALNREERILAALARAWVSAPDLLLADDPISGLGEASAARLVRHLAAAPMGLQQVTRLVSTSRLKMFLNVADRFLLVEDGALIELGDRASIQQCEHPWVQAELKSGAADF